MFKFIENMSNKRREKLIREQEEMLKKEEEERVKREQEEMLKKEEKERAKKREQEEKERLRKREQEEKERLRKREQDRVRRIEEEERLQKEAKEKFKKEVMNSYKLVPAIWSNYSDIINLILDSLEKCSVYLDETMVSNAFYKIHLLNEESCDFVSYLEKIRENIIGIINTELGYQHEFMETYINISFSDKGIILAIVNEMHSGNLELVPDLINNLVDAYQIYDEEEKYNQIESIKNQGILFVCMYTVAILIVLSTVKKIDIIKKNDELIQIINNLNSEFEIEVASKKLLPIYNKFYKDELDVDFDEIQLSIILNAVKNEKIECSMLDSIEIIFPGMLNGEISYEKLCSTIKQILGIIVLDDKDDIVLCARQIYTELLIELCSEINYNDLLSFILEGANFRKDINEYLEEMEITKERDRILKGDFTKEKVIENDKLNYESIETGIEFEKYLENIFRKLGYEVELTKASGDQGADLIVDKDKIKTVIQAKFYSNVVGNKAVQEVVSAIKYYNAQNAMVITNNYFTKSAIELGEANGIKLIDKDGLDMIRRTLFK